MTAPRVMLFALATLTATPDQLLAQSSEVLPRVVMLLLGSPAQPNQLANAFLEAMRENSCVDGRNLAFDLRYFRTSGDELERVVAGLSRSDRM